jgi:hypothetical protein
MPVHERGLIVWQTAPSELSAGMAAATREGKASEPVEFDSQLPQFYLTMLKRRQLRHRTAVRAAPFLGALASS